MEPRTNHADLTDALPRAVEFLRLALDLLREAPSESRYGDMARDIERAADHVDDAILRIKSAGHDNRWRE